MDAQAFVVKPSGIVPHGGGAIFLQGFIHGSVVDEVEILFFENDHSDYLVTEDGTWYHIGQTVEVVSDDEANAKAATLAAFLERQFRLDVSVREMH